MRNLQVFGNIKSCHFIKPTPIQRYTIPVLLDGRCDLMGCSNTGSGKTVCTSIVLLDLYSLLVIISKVWSCLQQTKRNLVTSQSTFGKSDLFDHCCLSITVQLIENCFKLKRKCNFFRIFYSAFCLLVQCLLSIYSAKSR